MFRFPIRRILLASSIISLGTVTQAALTHRYSFTEGGKDSVGNVAATLKGSAKIADGKLVLDNGTKGSDDPTLSYLEFAAPILPKSGSVSLAFWFTAPQDTNTFARILNFGDKEGAEGRAFIYFTPRNGGDQARSAITATDAGSKTFIDSDRLDDAKPHFVAMVIDGTTKKLHIFVDGKEPLPAEDLGENTLDKVRQVNNWLGRSSFDQDGGLSASIDEFRVYDHALSAAEVASMLKAGPDTLPATAPSTAPAQAK